MVNHVKEYWYNKKIKKIFIIFSYCRLPNTIKCEQFCYTDVRDGSFISTRPVWTKKHLSETNVSNIVVDKYLCYRFWRKIRNIVEDNFFFSLDEVIRLKIFTFLEIFFLLIKNQFLFCLKNYQLWSFYFLWMKYISTNINSTYVFWSGIFFW